MLAATRHRAGAAVLAAAVPGQRRLRRLRRLLRRRPDRRRARDPDRPRRRHRRCSAPAARAAIRPRRAWRRERPPGRRPARRSVRFGAVPASPATDRRRGRGGAGRRLASRRCWSSRSRRAASAWRSRWRSTVPIAFRRTHPVGGGCSSAPLPWAYPDRRLPRRRLRRRAPAPVLVRGRRSTTCASWSPRRSSLLGAVGLAADAQRRGDRRVARHASSPSSRPSPSGGFVRRERERTQRIAGGRGARADRPRAARRRRPRRQRDRRAGRRRRGRARARPGARGRRRCARSAARRTRRWPRCAGCSACCARTTSDTARSRGWRSCPALIEHARTAGVPSSCDRASRDRCRPRSTSTAYRIVQEALTNVRKHARRRADHRAPLVVRRPRSSSPSATPDRARTATATATASWACASACASTAAACTPAPAAGGGFEVIAQLPLP